MQKDEEEFKKLIVNDVFVTKEQQTIISKKGNESNWVFDFRKVLMSSQNQHVLSKIFYNRFLAVFPFQIGGLEVAAIPMVVSFASYFYFNNKPINAFFIRKSRKKYGLLNMVEGSIGEEKIILVDDILNSGQSFIRQVEVIESLGKKVDSIFVILRFRDLSYYSYFHNKGINIVSLFELDDFKAFLGTSNLISRQLSPTPMPFRVKWYFKSQSPNLHYVVPKSVPCIDEDKIYFGSDKGFFWALNQSDGTVVWKYKVGFHAKGKYIFSSPVIYRDTVCFGAYDGNFYALNRFTGKPEWVYMDADWIGSSPCVSHKKQTIFVGLEFGLFRKSGGVVAINANTGEKKWQFTTPEYVHSSPSYSSRFNLVVCGCNDAYVYALKADTGLLMWKFQVEKEVKASFVFDNKRNLVIFGSHDSYVYAVYIKTGELAFKFKTNEVIYSTPCIEGDRVYVSSLDKMLYCLDLNTGHCVWKFQARGRIFSSPYVHKNGRSIFVGTNDGMLYELDSNNGEKLSQFQATERITNKVILNEKTEDLFVSTFANEIYCLTR